MKGFGENFGIALCGLVTSVLVAILNVVVSRVTGFNLFSLSVWFIVPVGALLVGFGAASGYYFGSLYFHKRADKTLLVQMVVIAGFTQLLIYYMGYATLILDDGRKLSDYLAFGDYMKLTLTKAHYRVGRGAGMDTGEVGTMGYWMAALQFIGFLVGGLGVYGHLVTKTVCNTCNAYMRAKAKKVKGYASTDEAASYYDNLFQHPVDGPEFAELINTEAHNPKPKQGAVIINTELLSCPVCKAQLIEERLKVLDGSNWKDVDALTRKVQIPADIDLAPMFRS